METCCGENEIRKEKERLFLLMPLSDIYKK